MKMLDLWIERSEIEEAVTLRRDRPVVALHFPGAILIITVLKSTIHIRYRTR